MPLMSPNPLFSIVSAPAAATSRPQLKIGARTTQDVRGRTDEAYRHDHQWSRTLSAVKDSLIERTCEAAIEACEAGVAGVIDTLLKSATAEANAVAERARAEAKIEKAELQAELRQCHSVIDRLQADLSLARQQLDAAIAERAKLTATFQLVQRALSTETSGELQLEDAGHDGVMWLGPLQDVRTQNSSVIAPAPAGPPSPPVADTPAALGEAHPEAVGEAHPEAVGEAHPEAVEAIKRVLEQVQVIYEQDVKSDRSSAELVDSLTAHLQQARDVVLARANLSECDAKLLFEQQIDVMLDLMGGTSFGRHLSIAAYAAR
jgi:hypothetical protein